MALKTVTLTLTGAAQGDNLASVGLSNGVALGNKGIQHMLILAPASAITYGPQISGTFTSTPGTIAGAGSLLIGPFSNSGPSSTNEWYFKGTLSQVVTFLIITH